jgi:aerobic-type carbon monoxide dehydrogenase small subunit (CoxS/CutS family)
MMPAAIRLRVNGSERRVAVPPARSLLSVLRDELDLTGTKYGCGQAACGACTVMLDGEAVRSCITKVGTVGDRRVTTIEGLESGGKLHPLQQAFIDHGAMQCGYCTPGMIMASVGLLAQNPAPSESDVRDALAGNVCRCPPGRRHPPGQAMIEIARGRRRVARRSPIAGEVWGPSEGPHDSRAGRRGVPRRSPIAGGYGDRPRVRMTAARGAGGSPAGARSRGGMGTLRGSP